MPSFDIQRGSSQALQLGERRARAGPIESRTACIPRETGVDLGMTIAQTVALKIGAMLAQAPQRLRRNFLTDGFLRPGDENGASEEQRYCQRESFLGQGNLLSATIGQAAYASA